MLDIVKHSVRTIIENLGENDSLSLVSFNSDATLAFAHSKMTAEKKKEATDVLSKMYPGGGTYMWQVQICFLFVE